MLLVGDIPFYLKYINKIKLFMYSVRHNYMFIIILQGVQKVSMHLMITIQKVTSNVQSVPRQSPDIY